MAMTNLHDGTYYVVICGADDRYRIRHKLTLDYALGADGMPLEYEVPWDANTAAYELEHAARKKANQPSLF